MFVAPMGFFAGGTATEGELLKRIKFDSSVDTGITYQGGAAPEIEASTGRRVLTCNGGKYLTIDNFESVYGADIIATGKMTVSFWFKADSGQTLTLNEFQSLWGKSPYRNSNMLILDTRQHWGAQYRLNPGLYAMYTASNSFTLSAGGIPLGTGTPNPAYGAWHHISMVYTGTDIEIYIDGNLAASNFENGGTPSSLSAVMANGVAFAVGHNPAYSGTVAFKGKISDFHLHNKALTQAEVQTVKDSYETVPTVALTESNDGTDITLGVTLTDPGSVASGWAYRINTPLGAIGAPHGGTLQTGNSVVITGQSAALHTIYVAAVDASGNVVGPSQTIQSDLRDVQTLVRSDLNRYFHFNGDLNDYSTNNNHATMAVGTATYTTDKWNQKAFLPQDNALVDTGHPMISTDTTYTIAAWVYSDVAHNDAVLCHNGYHYVTWGPGGIYLNFGGSANSTGFHYRYSNSNVTAYTCATPSLSTGAWHHVVAVQNGSTMQIWVDGVKETEITNATNAPFSTSNNMIIGGLKSNQGGDGGWRFEATDLKIDEFAYWTKSLTQAEIEYLWNSGSGRHIYDPASTIDASVTVTGSTVDITATLGDPAGNGGGGWAYSTSALGAVGAPHGGTAVPSGNTAQITGAADGSYTLYYALIDGSGNVVVKDSTTYGVGLSGDIVANWSFDGNANSSVGSGLNGTVTGATQVAGRANGSFAYQAAASTDNIDITGTNLLPGVTNEVSLSFWVYGTEASLPADTTLIEAYDASNNRVFNVHFWSNSNLYWDAGNSGGSSYDRMNKAMSTSENEGQWNHWVCTKNATTGDMKIYLNGALWHSATGKTRTMSPISKIRILNALASLSWPYLGKIDSMVIYKKELSAAEVLSVYNSEIVPTITAATSVSGGTVSITATLTDPNSAATGGWAYSTSALGAVGQPHGGTAVSSGTTAQITGAADGTYTLYVALIDSSGNVIGAKSDSEYVVGAITLTAFQTDSYGDAWNGASVAISPQGGAVIWTLTGPAHGVKAPAGKTDTLAVAPGTYSYSVTAGSYPGEVGITITDQYGNTLASLTGNSGTGTFVVATQVTAFQVHGYYPLYNTAADANSAAEGNGTSHTHVLDSVTYYMPNGIAGGPGGGNQFHGTYGQASKYALDYDASDSWGTNDGTVSGTTFVADGNKRHALFDGSNDTINLGDKAEFEVNASDSRTFSLWFKLDSSAASSWMHLLTKRNVSSNNTGWALYKNSTNKLDFALLSGGTAVGAVTTNSAVSNNTWYHVAVTIDRENDIMKIYLDGTLQTTTQSLTSVGSVASTNPLYMAWGDNIAHFHGVMDDFRVWTRALAASEISSLHSTGRADSRSLTDGLTGTWNFNAGNANDSVGSNNGTASNITFATADGRSYAEANASNNRIDLGNISALDFGTGAFSVSAWVYMDSIPNGSHSATILAKGMTSLSSPQYNGFALNAWNGTWRWFVGGDGSYKHITTPATTGKWVHLLATRSGTELKLYVDGSLATSDTDSATRDTDNTYVASMLSHNNGTWYDDYFDGKLDDVRTWSHALTAGEAEEVYLQGRLLTDGLVSKYALDYDANDSVGSNNGTLTNVTFATDGTDKRVAVFDGTAQISAGTNFQFTNEDFTYSLWIKPTSATQNGYAIVFGAYEANYTGYYLSQDASNHNSYRFTGNDGSSWSGDNSRFSLTVDAWTHVVIVRSGTTITVYKNGSLEYSDSSEIASTIGYGSSNPPLTIGNSWSGGGYNYAWQGRIDDMRVWDRALSATEASSLYSAGRDDSISLTEDLLGTWNFDSANANDSVGSNNGTANNITFTTAGGRTFADLNGTNGEILLDQSVGDHWGSNATWSMWFKTTATASAQDDFLYMVRESYSGSSQSYFTVTMKTAGHLIANMRNKSGTFATAPSWAATVVNDGNWHMVTFVREGTSLHLYVDGSLEGSLTNISGTFLANVPVRIGSYSAGSTSPSKWFDGQIDDMRMWTRALAAQEVASLYSSTKLLTDGLVAKYALDYDAYDTAGSNNGTISGATFSATGNKRQAVFDGTNDYIEIPNDSSLNSTTGTISFWVNSTATSHHSIIGKHDSSASRSGYHVYLDNGKAMAQIKDSTLSMLTLTGPTVNDGAWHHVALTYTSGGTTTLFVDGSSVQSGNAPSFTTSTQALRIGESIDTFWGNFQGSLDDVRIWNRILSSSEISSLNSAGRDDSRTLTTGLTAHYTLDSDVSATVGSDGTNSGATFSTVGSHKFASFDGSNDSMTIPHSNAEQPFNTDSTSVSMWLKTTTTSESRLLFKAYGPSSNESVWDHRVMTDGKAYFYWRDETNTIIKTLTSTTSVNDGSWHHVLVVRDGSTIKMYVDGTLEATATGVSGTWSGTYDMHLGKWDHPSHSASHWFNGSLDDVKIWSHALSATEATALYNEGHPGVFTLTENRTGYWRLETDAQDYQGSNNGTVTGATFSEVSGKSFATFDGNDYISLPHNASNDWSQNQTVSLWMNTTTTARGHMLGKWSSTSGTDPSLFNVWVNDSSGVANKATFGFRNSNNVVHTANSTTSVNDGYWHHVVIVLEGSSTMKIYVDGTLEDTTTGITAGNFTSTRPIYLGVQEQPWLSGVNASTYYDGKLDDIQVWDRALSASEISTLHSNGRPDTV